MRDNGYGHLGKALSVLTLSICITACTVNLSEVTSKAPKNSKLNGSAQQQVPPPAEPLSCKVEPGGCDEVLSDLEIVIKNRHLPGKKLCIKAGTYRSLSLESLTGEPGNPVTIINCEGKVTFDTNGWPHGITGKYVQYLRMTGTGDPSIKYGIEQKNAALHGLSFDEGITDIEIDHLEVHDNGYLGIGVRSYPRCDGLHNRSNFVQYNTLIHHNYIHDVDGEGFYIGTSHYDATSARAYIAGCPETNYLEPPLVNVKVYNNVVEDTGNDGIQVGAAISGMEVYNNVVKRYALSQSYGHVGGLQINPGSVGKVYNNWVESAKGLVETAIQYSGGGDGSIEFYDNVLLNSHTPIMTLGSLLNANHETIFRNNTIVSTGGNLMSLYCFAKYGLSLSNVHPMTIEDNIFVGYDDLGENYWTDPSSGARYFKIFNQGAALCPINGLVYNGGLKDSQKIAGNFYSTSVADAQFIDEEGGNYSVEPTSPAFGKGASYVAPE